LSSSAASITSLGSECSAASSTTMLKPIHIQVVTTISDGSAVLGLPSQALARPPSPSARSAAFTGPQSKL
jgi:hypothetical protein